MTEETRRIGVVGAGTMGCGIAVALTAAGLPVVLVDANPAGLEAGVARIAATCDEAVRRGKIDAEEAARRVARVRPTTLFADLADCAVVIEAVYEDLALKSRIAAELGAVCGPETILASNTSSLDINVMARASGRADRYLGMHFFSPAHIMRLVEVARGDATSAETVARAVALVRSLSKTPVVCGVCFGFIGNRMAEPYLREAEAMILEGATAAEIDAVAQSPEMLGMAMGPCRMMDLAGLDVGASIIAERAAATNLLDDASYRAMVRALTARGHLGQKTGQGFYRYEGRQPVAAPETEALAAELAAGHGITRRSHIPAEEILRRLLYPLINEGFDVLREGIATDSADIDTVFATGYGFPAARTGPMAMAREIGPRAIHDWIAGFARERGDPHGYWVPSPLLAEHAQSQEAAQ